MTGTTCPLDVFLSTHPPHVGVPRFRSTLPLDVDSPPTALSPCLGVPRSVSPPCRRDRRSSVAPIPPTAASSRDPCAGRTAAEPAPTREDARHRPHRDRGPADTLPSPPPEDRAGSRDSSLVPGRRVRQEQSGMDRRPRASPWDTAP